MNLRVVYYRRIVIDDDVQVREIIARRASQSISMTIVGFAEIRHSVARILRERACCIPSE